MRSTALTLFVVSALVASIVTATAPSQPPNTVEPCRHSDAAASRSNNATGWFSQIKVVCTGAKGCENHVKKINCEAGAACKWVRVQNCTSSTKISEQVPEDGASVNLPQPGTHAASNRALLKQKVANSSRHPGCAPGNPAPKYHIGEWVDVMILESGQKTSDRWRRCVVTAVDCQGRYSLMFDNGQAASPALSTGIEAHHLRPTQIGIRHVDAIIDKDDN